MDEILNNAKLLNQSIQDLINPHSDKIIEAASAFEELDKLYQAAKALSKEIELIKLSGQATIITYLKRLRADIEILDNPDATLSDIQKLQLPTNNSKEVAPGITLNTNIVPNASFIPDTPLYYINDTNEYGIKVNGTLISGIIHDIVNKRTKIPEIKDLLNADSIWTAGNFLYTTEPLMQKNKFMRHIGSRSNLKMEIENSTDYEKLLRSKQLAHDMLIQLAISAIL